MTTLGPGAMLQNRYRIVRQLGQGGFGAVYEAVDQRLNRRVAIKRLLRADERLVRRFVREAQLLANLSHSALPRVTDYFDDPGGQFLIMDYIPGDDLAGLLEQRASSFPVAQVLEWADQLLGALHYLHTREPPIIHRDIKPQNLKLQADGRIILLDFGLAKGYAGEVAPVTGGGSLMAYTEGYAPPEQVEGTGTDARSDLYGLGATLYCLLAYAHPVEARTRLLAVARRRPDPLRPLHEVNREVTPAVSRVLHQAMELEAGARPPSAQAMRTALQAVRSGASAQGGAAQQAVIPPQTTDRPGMAPTTPPPVPHMPPAAREPRLHIVQPDGTIRQSALLTSRGLAVGRAPTNDLVLAVRTISGHHMRVAWDGQQVLVTDLGSSNGTWLGRERLIPHRAMRWDPREWLFAGSVWMRLQTPSGGHAAPTPRETQL